MRWYLGAFKKYARFKGRASRKEYWLFTLFNLILLGTLVVVDNAAGLVVGDGIYGPLSALYCLVVFLPAVAICVRRLHDINRSGWWWWLCLVPFGVLVVLVFTMQEGQPARNRFGPDPKELESATADFGSDMGAARSGNQAKDRRSPGVTQVRSESNDEFLERHPATPSAREFCSECGAMTAGARFCPQCGVRADNRDAASVSPMASSSMPRGREDAVAAAPSAQQSFARPSVVDSPRHRAANGSDGSPRPQAPNVELPVGADAAPSSFPPRTLPEQGGQTVQSVGGPSYCPSCGARAEGKKFCRRCGESLQAENECASCGSELRVNQRFCHRCGAGRA